MLLGNKSSKRERRERERQRREREREERERETEKIFNFRKRSNMCMQTWLGHRTARASQCAVKARRSLRRALFGTQALLWVKSLAILRPSTPLISALNGENPG